MMPFTLSANRWILTLLLNVAVLAVAQAATDDATKAELLAAESRLAAAIVAGESATVAELLDDDYAFSVPEGGNITKAKFLADMKEFWKPTRQEHREQAVRVAGETAVIAGRAVFEWTSRGESQTATERYTDTWIRRKGGWRKYASHSHAEYPSPVEAEAQVRRVIERMDGAWSSGDRAVAASIYDKDFFDTDPSGVLRNRSQVLEFVKPPRPDRPTTSRMVKSDWRVLIRGPVAFVNCAADDITEKDGAPVKTFRFRDTSVLLYQYGHWRMLSGQQTEIKGK